MVKTLTKSDEPQKIEDLKRQGYRVRYTVDDYLVFNNEKESVLYCPLREIVYFCR
jgi:hypothetical protein